MKTEKEIKNMLKEFEEVSARYTIDEYVEGACFGRESALEWVLGQMTDDKVMKIE